MTTPLILIGPSGAGKSTIARALEETSMFEIIRSYTTRPRRPDEDDTTHYFVSEQDFQERKNRGEFIGDTELFGHHYGLPYFSETKKHPLLILRAPFVPIVLKQYPTSVVVQLEAPIAQLIDRLKERQDNERASQDDFAREIALGKQLATLSISTAQPIKACMETILNLLTK